MNKSQAIFIGILFYLITLIFLTWITKSLVFLVATIAIMCFGIIIFVVLGLYKG